MPSSLIPATPADSDAVSRLIDTLTRTYPFLQRVSIGSSVCGRRIDALCLGADDYAAAPENARRAVLFAAAFHAQEWITSLIALRLCEELCRLYIGETRSQTIDFASSLHGRLIVFVPQVNPDGADIALYGAATACAHAAAIRPLGADLAGLWQANARGVDLNHNFHAGWETLREMERKSGIFGPAPRRFGGEAPESEPETKALCDLCRRIPFSHVAALHTQGEEIYWQYGERTPPQAHLTARLLAAFSGYRVSEPTGLASHGGFKDWFIQQTGRMGFTFELGRGVNPLPLAKMEDIYQKAREMLLLCAVLG